MEWPKEWKNSCVSSLIDRYVCGGVSLREGRLVPHGSFFSCVIDESNQSSLVVDLKRQAEGFRDSVKLFHRNGLSKNSIISAHKIMYRDADYHGFRSLQNFVGQKSKKVIVHIPPPADKILELFNDWLKSFHNGKDEDLNQIIVQYVRFLSIYPFRDGNGRTARAILEYLLEKSGFAVPNLELNRFRFDEENYSRNFSVNLDNDISEKGYWKDSIKWAKLVNEEINERFENTKK